MRFPKEALGPYCDLELHRGSLPFNVVVVPGLDVKTTAFTDDATNDAWLKEWVDNL